MDNKKTKTVTAWAGIVERSIAAFPANDGYSVPGYILEIFKTRKAARARYERVQKVEIKFVGNR